MRPGEAVRQIEIVAVLHALQRLVGERVEDELAGDAEHVDGGGTVLGDEGTRGLEVLAKPDLLFVVATELGIAVAAAEVLDDLVLARAVVVDPESDGELVDPVAHVGISVLGEQVRRLQEVRVGVVDHAIGHRRFPPSCAGTVLAEPGLQRAQLVPQRGRELVAQGLEVLADERHLCPPLVGIDAHRGFDCVGGRVEPVDV